MKKDYKILYFSRQAYSTYLVDAKALSVANALAYAEETYIQSLKTDMGYTHEEAQEEWNSGEYSALIAFEATAEHEVGELI